MEWALQQECPTGIYQTKETAVRLSTNLLRTNIVVVAVQFTLHTCHSLYTFQVSCGNEFQEGLHIVCHCHKGRLIFLYVEDLR